VLTVTPGTVARLCPELSDTERDQFQSIPYQGVVCASLLLDAPLADYYLTYLMDEGLPFTAVVEMSAFVDRDQLKGRSLVYLPRYAPPSDPFFEMSDEDIRKRFLDALQRLYPHFSERSVRAFRVSRVREVFPLPRLGYSSRLPPTTPGSAPGVVAISSAHIVNGTLNVNDTVRIAERASRSLLLHDGNRLYLD
jgi:protoporphyrinogen oxidase